MRLKRLNQKLATLERLSDFYLEKEHVDIFSEIERLPGRHLIIRAGDRRSDTIESQLLDVVRAQKDAERLHRCSALSHRLHIGISVPRVHRRDFAFLLSMHGTSHEVLVQPVTIKAVHDPSMVANDLATALSTLASKTQDSCYMVPTLSTSAGFIGKNMSHVSSEFGMKCIHTGSRCNCPNSPHEADYRQVSSDRSPL